MALVLAVRNTDSLTTPKVSCRYAAASTKPPNAPTAAASVGVARPNTMEPKTARIRISKGKKLDSSILKISSRA